MADKPLIQNVTQSQNAEVGLGLSSCLQVGTYAPPKVMPTSSQPGCRSRNVFGPNIANAAFAAYQLVKPSQQAYPLRAQAVAVSNFSEQNLAEGLVGALLALCLRDCILHVSVAKFLIIKIVCGDATDT